MKKSIVIVGAGLGGLTAAALLAQKGHTVKVIEQFGWVGGKSRRLTIAGQTIDSGPSLVTFPMVWEKLVEKIALLGGNTQDQPKFVKLPEVGRYFFRDQQIDIPIPKDHEWFPAWERFVREHAHLQTAIAELLMTNPVSTSTLGAVRQLVSVYGKDLNSQKYLDSLDWMPIGLRELIGIHALNAGVAPAETLPIFASVTAIMSVRGITVPVGGVNELSQFLAKVAEAAGAEIILNTRVERIGRKFVQTAERKFAADIVISAIDREIERGLSNGSKGKVPKRRSCSGVAIYATLTEELATGSVMHSVVMPDRPSELYLGIKQHRQPSQTMSFVNYYAPNTIYPNSKPVVGVLLTSVANGETANLDTPWVKSELGRISQVMGLDYPIESKFEEYEILDPSYFATISGSNGSIYGKVNPVWRSGPFHSPRYRSLTRPWLFRVGASVHPGGGIPAVIGGAMNSIAPLL